MKRLSVDSLRITLRGMSPEEAGAFSRTLRDRLAEALGSVGPDLVEGGRLGRLDVPRVVMNPGATQDESARQAASAVAASVRRPGAGRKD